MHCLSEHALRRVRYLLVVLLSFLGLACGQAFAQSAPKDKADVVLNGDARCTKCHDESETKPVLSIGKTKHGVRADSRLPTCSGCHGDSDTHVNKPAGVSERPKPTFPFGKSMTQKGVAEHDAVCASCHKGGKFMHWPGSVHSARDISCTSCHQIHTAHDKVKDRRTQPEVCFTCHKEQKMLFNKPSHHPVPEGKMACSDCHSPHGSAGPKLMQRDSVAATCFTCHMEKRGPFLRKHEPTEDCTTCHNPHGTAVDNLLKFRPPFLCQQCHEPATHQGGFPGLAGAAGGNAQGTRGITNARACLNCHTNIHGTNNPANAAGERVFRR